MVKKCCVIFLATVILMWVILPVAFCAVPSPPPTVAWSWLQKQVADGAKEITLTGNISRSEEEGGLLATGTVTISGKGFVITGAQVDSGTVIFQDVSLSGVHGIEEENGQPALTLRGKGTVAVLSGNTQVIGGRSGIKGEHGGNGILLTDDQEGVLLRNRAYIQGGAGYLYGASGIKIEGNGCSILLTDNAAAMGGIGLANGGAGLEVPSCAKVDFKGKSTAVGAASVYAGGDGILSTPCAVCQQHQTVSVEEEAMITSGVGETGGNAIHLERSKTSEAPDLMLKDTITLMGGAGGTAGASILAKNAMISFAGTPTLYGGDYYATKAAALSLTGSGTEGDMDTAIQLDGNKLEKHPASDMSLILNQELSQISSRYTPMLVEKGLTTLELTTKMNDLSVEKGRVSRVSVGGGLKINLWNATLEKRLDFNQRFSTDGKEGIRLILIASSSEHWLSLESAVTSLRKLQSLGITQLAYTSVDPVYCERIVDIDGLLAAIEADEGESPVEQVILGTADDCVIFVRKDKTRDYQEELMPEIRRMLSE